MKFVEIHFEAAIKTRESVKLLLKFYQ